MKKIAFTTLGCKSNQYDTESMRAACRCVGFAVVPFDEAADAYVINTCTVTGLADAQGRQLVRRAHRRSPDAFIIAVGCSVQADADAYRAIPEVDAVFGVRCIDALIDYLVERFAMPAPGEPPSMSFPREQARARALLKIQDGCDRRCTYCAVWQVRGASTSVETDEVIERYRALAEYSEVMLTGIHIGQYGCDRTPATSLWDLIAALLRERHGPRIRLGSLDPDEFDERLLGFLQSPRMCRHVHLSVQSGSARVLAAMGRAYHPDDIARLAAMLAERVPGIAIGADLIAGFPGETEDDHRATVELIDALPIAMLHVFPFSPRPGTVAASLPGEVSQAARKRRARELIALGARKREVFIRSQIGTEARAVVVSRQPEAANTMRAVTDNYINVRCSARPGSYGRSVTVHIDAIHDGEVRALCG